MTQTNYLFTGGTGFLGQTLIKALPQDLQGQIFVVSRQKAIPALHPAVKLIARLEDIDQPIDYVFNLAGHPIAEGRWTAKRKEAIWHSRIGITRDLVSWMSQQKHGARFTLSTSASGFYGSSLEVDEDSPKGSGFAAELCQAWETEAQGLKAHTERLVILRTSVVLSPQNGMLARLLPVFKLGLGGRIGDGQQGLSWIHLADYCRLVQFLMASQLEGVLNAASPEPVSNRVFTQALAQTLNRPACLPVPKWLINLSLGEMGTSLLTEGQFMVPKRALNAGFEFKYLKLAKALADLLA